jgi:DNA-binding response OmpR family regulator
VQKRILLVEDDRDLVELIRFNLQQAGFSVGTALDGIEGLKKARTLRPDLILLDLMLPELDGFALCEIFRQDPALSSVPVIIVTAMTSQLSRINGLACGARRFITKPFSPKGLVSSIREVLSDLAQSPSASEGSAAAG